MGWAMSFSWLWILANPIFQENVAFYYEIVKSAKLLKEH